MDGGYGTDFHARQKSQQRGEAEDDEKVDYDDLNEQFGNGNVSASGKYRDYLKHFLRAKSCPDSPRSLSLFLPG